MAAATFTKSGAKAATAAKLSKDVFDLEVTNTNQIKLAYEAYLAEARNSHATAKGRSDVRGGGRKPWKQKGTGRARHGSIRSPIWRGGGVTFGPTGNENHVKQQNKKAKRLAIRQSLSLANKDGAVSVIDSFEFKSPKTSDAAKLLSKIGCKRRTLVVVHDKSETLVKSFRNIEDVKVVQAMYLNVYDIVNAHHIVIEKEALKTIETWLTGEAK